VPAGTVTISPLATGVHGRAPGGKPRSRPRAITAVSPCVTTTTGAVSRLLPRRLRNRVTRVHTSLMLSPPGGCQPGSPHVS
jgi:hypothetical protein